MSYYFSTSIRGRLEQVEARVTQLLNEQGFGVLTEIDIQATLHKKLGVEFPGHKILGACNPPLAYKALQAENKVGTMLPCNVIIREIEEDQIEVAAVNPLSSMQAIQNSELEGIAGEVTGKLKSVIDNLRDEK